LSMKKEDLAGQIFVQGKFVEGVLKKVAENELLVITIGTNGVHVGVFTPAPEKSMPIPNKDNIKSLEEAKSFFPGELVELLSFEDSPEKIIVKPRKFLGSDNFAKIAAVIRDLHGEYVSAGKDSHFVIPKKQ